MLFIAFIYYCLCIFKYYFISPLPATIPSTKGRVSLPSEKSLFVFRPLYLSKLPLLFPLHSYTNHPALKCTISCENAGRTNLGA